MRNYVDSDRIRIATWPVYPPEYAELDYALRVNGWIDEFAGKPETHLYVFEQDGELIAFTILAGTTAGEAEFRIALRADRLGRGLGKALTTMTINQGFTVIQLHRLHLIVRTDNESAKRLYLNSGFVYCGKVSKITNGKQVNYLAMELLRDNYKISCL